MIFLVFKMVVLNIVNNKLDNFAFKPNGDNLLLLYLYFDL